MNEEMNKDKYEFDYLNEDPEIRGQRYACVSVMEANDKIKNCTVRGLKIRGVYSSEEEANKRATYLQKNVDNKYNIYVCEVGKWIPFSDNIEMAEKLNYDDKDLNALMEKTYTNNVKELNTLAGIKEEQEKDAKKEFKQRIIDTTKNEVERVTGNSIKNNTKNKPNEKILEQMREKMKLKTRQNIDKLLE